ncbi:glycosyltransferase [Synechococcus sp. 8F6]|uniref:glycosyltransferase n=1 Tax=Synechococcus sp. 8F6 TaxID=2025606 RepID=UPI000B99A441|nr:glycosyltransferase [Synechococcus sp. 8F6]
MNPSIIFVSSHAMSVVSFILPHIRALKAVAPVQVLANTSDSTLLKRLGVDSVIQSIPVVRPIAPWMDLKALCILYFCFTRGRPLAVHTITPKAGFLGMAAAWMARVPVRVHSFTGQVWVTRHGLVRWLLKSVDKLTAAMATDVLVDSPSQLAFLVGQGVVSASRGTVLGAGSICGVNTQRFRPDKIARQAVRKKLGTPTGAFVCLYLGRLNYDKGVLDLARAFAKVASSNANAELWVVGPDEANLFGKMQVLLQNVKSQVKRVDFTPEPERFMQAADLFCMPSYREGFGSSVIEAAACGVPALVSDIYGLTDAVVDGKTGWMHEAGNVQELARRMEDILANPSGLESKGQAAQSYAAKFFAEELITNLMVEFYNRLLNEKTA